MTAFAQALEDEYQVKKVQYFISEQESRFFRYFNRKNSFIQKFYLRELKELQTHIKHMMNQNVMNEDVVNSLTRLYREIIEFTKLLCSEFKQSSISLYTTNINSYRAELFEINRKSYQTLETNKSDSLVLQRPQKAKTIYIEERFIKVPLYLQIFSWVSSNLTALLFYSIGGFFILWLISSMIMSAKNNIKFSSENDLLTTIASTPLNAYQMLETEMFNKKTFRDYVILLEKSNKEKSPEAQWNIKFNDAERFVFFNKSDLSQNQCRSLVALKETSFDVSSVKVNGINLPSNFWTASDDKKWSQNINQNLCSLKQNSVEIAMGSSIVKQESRKIYNMTSANYNFLIQQHQIALQHNNSDIVEDGLKKKIELYKQMLEKRKSDIKT